MSNSHVTDAPIIRTTIDPNGESRVLFSIGNEVRLVFTPDTAVTIALNLLSAAYAARGEQAAFKYAVDNHIDPAILIKYVRDISGK